MIEKLKVVLAFLILFLIGVGVALICPIMIIGSVIVILFCLTIWWSASTILNYIFKEE